MTRKPPAVDDEEIVVVGDEENAIKAADGAKEGIEVPAPADVFTGTQRQREFPDAFYDPVTDQTMVDPVVNEAGYSYERSRIDTSTAVYYPNRALQSIIQRETKLAATAGSLRGSLRRIDQHLQSGWSRLLEKSAFPSANYRPLPDSFYCPISCELMVDPVVAPDGNSYEREAIENWIRCNGLSPMTKMPLTAAELRPNNALYDLIQNEKKRTNDSIHPSIRRWKESTAVTSRRPLKTSSAEIATTDVVVEAVPSAPLEPVPPVLAPTATATSYPTTEAEILERRRRNRKKSKWVIVLFTVLAVLVFPPLTLIFLVLAFLSCCLLEGDGDPNSSTYE
jgi:U-box domain